VAIVGQRRGKLVPHNPFFTKICVDILSSRSSSSIHPLNALLCVCNVCVSRLVSEDKGSLITMVDAMENLQALLGQEQSRYRVMDYMKRMQSEASTPSFAQGSKPLSSGEQRDSASTSCSTRKRKDGPDADCTQVEPSTKRLRSNESTSEREEEASSPASPSRPQISRQWREKICEWAFKGKPTTDGTVRSLFQRLSRRLL
jgi:hypothetical protein